MSAILAQPAVRERALAFSKGREREKARGVRLGCKPKLTPHQQREAVKRRDAGEALADIARSYNMSHSTISRLAV
ncbi:MAG: helix-turn-helix domain-containing protein [Acetobacteraceae bacterium]|nr:helix-turn-helix domain-containing protein [Acetobacteraceae bacterium]MBV8523201.1 helix-turn-helix domain-containing protein [Acetobacteraceae bacterium]